MGGIRRREFLAGGLAGAVAAATGCVPRVPADIGEGHRWGMTIDLDRCTGCRACVAACWAENNIPMAKPDQGDMGRQIMWMDVVEITEGSYPEVRSTFMPTPCMHCDSPPCIKVCPVSATFRTEEGLVGQIYGRCIGCRYCANACPYTRRYFNWFAPEWPEELKSQLNPDVPVRPKGVMEKCTFCIHRIQAAKDRARAEGREMRDGDVVTACQQACPASAIVFGDLNDRESAAARLSKSPRAFTLLEDLGTHPKVFYLKEERTER